MKVVFTDSAVPESVTFGYKRKEMSLIPLVTVGKPAEQRAGEEVIPAKKKTDVYGSVLAFIDVNTAPLTSILDTSIGVSQFIATGCAAERIGKNNQSVREAFKMIAGVPATVACIKTWLGNNDTHWQELDSWWRDKGLPGSAVPAIYEPEFKQRRLDLIVDKTIPCNL